MKKRIISLVLVVVLVCAMCLSASAASASGKTSGPIKKDTSASLTVLSNGAVASTWCESSTTLSTYVDFTYINTNNREASYVNIGDGSAGAYPSDIKDSLSAICADSYHTVTSSVYGTWECNLHQDKW